MGKDIHYHQKASENRRLKERESCRKMSLIDVTPALFHAWSMADGVTRRVDQPWLAGVSRWLKVRSQLAYNRKVTQ